MKTTKAIVKLLCASFFITGCADDWKAEINSNTSWYGEVGGRSGSGISTKTVSGRGDKTIDLPDDERVCCVVQKQTYNGSLKVKIVNKGGGPFGLFASDGEESETEAPYGTVTVCANSQQ